MNRLVFQNKGGGKALDALLPDEAMAEYATKLAARLSINDRARLRMRGTSPMRLGRVGDLAERLASQSDALPPAMEWLTGNIRWVEQSARALNAARTPKLPARDGMPRIERLMRETVAHSDARVSEERLISVLTAFDGVQGLSMAEIWLAPLALRMALLDAFQSVSEQVLNDQRARLEAEKWVRGGAPQLAFKGRIGSAFCERALKLLHEQESPEARRALEEWIDERSGDSQTMIRRAHERQAMNRLVLEGLMTSLRILDGLNWDAAFESICRAEIALREDAVYPRMDEASRCAVRDQVSMLSRRSGLSEWTVARHAVRAAHEKQGAQATCCWWLYDDEGRRALLNRLGAEKAYLNRIVPDPEGKACLAAFGLVSFLLLLILWGFAPHWYLLPGFVILAWRYGVSLVGQVVTRVLRPRPLLKIELERIPDDMRTLVVIPALLSSAGRTTVLVEQLEALGALNQNENLEFLLLGDFRDAEEATLHDDEDILLAARQGIERLNAVAGRTAYHYLNRGRVYVPSDGRFMGHERKRGALMALNRLLLGGESEFDAEEHCAPQLRNRFAYVLTLDADARLLPGAILELIGTAAHPLNHPRVENGKKRGYALFQPRVELSAGGRFARLLGGVGGVDSYPTLASSAYQDACGRGIFGGKGLYNLRAFSSALEGVLPDGAILSHDLIEGALAGTGYVGDVTVHDGFPGTLGGYLKRLHRWTRGDWQLTPFLFGKLRLSAFDRFLMLDNLARSLSQAAAVYVVMLSMWTGTAHGLLIGLIEPFLPVLLSLPRIGGEQVRRAIAKLALLPVEGFVCVDAAVRALYRMRVSRKNLLEWTPAADAEGQAGKLFHMPGRIAAMLLIPALFHGGWTAGVLGVGLLFLIGVDWMRALEAAPPANRLSGEQIEALNDLAKRTWHFFEVYVPLEGTGLPPDNVQIDPPVGIANRTSPTNIGLYLTSCLSARELGLLTPDRYEARVQRTVSTLESLDKWRGHLYNWYDIDALSPLPPRYVSAVDSGNLAACLLMAAAATQGELGERMEVLARQMDFSALYDAPRRLFYIGYDAERDRLSSSYYDLLASESRILSYTAIALGCAPVCHWFKLGRPRDGRALISWSGTLFEYLMPELFLRSPEGALVGESNRAVVAMQKRAHPGAWGVSESGFFAFDMQMNYQYRAFGLSDLSLRGGSFDDVIAPYASILALSVDAQAALENLKNMKDKGWMGDFGLYEAVDFDDARLPSGMDCRVVMSHMAHHQGMILSAVANALTGDKLVKYFSGRSEMRALSMLLEEKPARPAPHRARRRTAEPVQRRQAQRSTRAGLSRAAIPDGHLLYGGGATYFVRADGGGFLRMRGVMAGRFREGLFEGEVDGLFAHVKIDGRPVDMTQQVQFGEGEAQWVRRAGDVNCRLIQMVSPEDGALYQQVILQNGGSLPAEVEVTGCFAVALCAQRDLRAHPAFQNLFVDSEAPSPGVLIFRRRARDNTQQPLLVYRLCAPEGARYSFETDMTRLIGRDGALDRSETLRADFTCEDGPTLNPCAALRAHFSVAPGDKCRVAILVGMAQDESAARALRARSGQDAAERARLLAMTQSRAMLDFLSLDAKAHHLLQRASAFLFYPQLRMAEWIDEKLSVGGLWALGISGDLPILSVFVHCKDQVALAAEAARAHEFYRAMGVWCDLVFINDYGNDYMQPVRDQLRQLIERSHLREIGELPGGARLIEGQSLSPAQRALLTKCSALWFEGGTGSMCTQLRSMLDRPEKKERGLKPMEVSAAPAPAELIAGNGYGGFSKDGSTYVIDRRPGHETPAAWCNVLANPDFGLLISERGGGFAWALNSRMCRLTAWSGDPLREGFPVWIGIEEAETRRFTTLLPAPPPARAEHGQGYTRIASGADGLQWKLTLFVDDAQPLACARLHMENKTGRTRRLNLTAAARFLMGAGAEEARMTCVRGKDGLIVARGAMEGAGYLRVKGGKYTDGVLRTALTLAPGANETMDVLLGWAPTVEACDREIERFEAAGGAARLEKVMRGWAHRLTRIEMILPDTLMSAMVTRWLPYQALSGRVLARAGLYQAGGAYGFRDQLQDMLCLIPIEPERVRAHLLLCAGRQFEAGDVLHWWHAPMTGVRTRISDDMLFLPYVAARYVRETGDADVMDEQVAYLRDVELPEGREDVYARMEPSDVSESLHAHCMRAIRRAARTGPHGLPLMGSGDWNDGMNRVGAGDAGESVWLGEFLSVVADEYARILKDERERGELATLAEDMRQMVEAAGWDGRWYRRAYYADGSPMGSDAPDAAHGCRIDLIAQGWAVKAGLDSARAHEAMKEAWKQLVDERTGVIKLLTPPFDGEASDPGYIAAYPGGVRENGGQYTHGACWGVMGWAGLDQERAWRAFDMLMPYTHARTPEAVMRYRVEPYVVAADVYSEPPFAGRGGWTWYTGAASWLCRVALTELLGFEREGDRARLRALLPHDWPEASVRVRTGASTYQFTARRGVKGVTLDGKAMEQEWIALIDDGATHEAVYPPRNG